MVCAECVLETRVRRTGIDEIRPTQLSDVTKALEDFGINELKRQLVDTNVVPDGVAQNLEADRPCLCQIRIRLWGRRF